MANDLELALECTAAAASIIRERFGSVDAEMKGEVDPVTEADRQAERAIIDILQAAVPHDLILGEEGGGALEPFGRRWIIDPLDGTVNFLHGLPHVAVSVALYEGDRALVGVVLDVFREEVFAAELGHQATLNDRPIATTTIDDLGAALVATGFAYDRRQRGREYAATLGEVLVRVRGIRRAGTASLDLAWLAAGRLDAFWELGLAPWDTAAGLLIVTEAGGVATDLAGEPSAPGDPAIVAAGPGLHAQFLELIGGAT